LYEGLLWPTDMNSHGQGMDGLGWRRSILLIWMTGASPKAIADPNHAAPALRVNKLSEETRDKGLDLVAARRG
jgi:hypothetical protein